MSGLPTLGPGTWLIFGIVLAPVYGLLLGWFLGEPRDSQTSTLGVVYLVGFTVALWGGLGVLTILLGVIFF